jgi:hypothetical protein
VLDSAVGFWDRDAFARKLQAEHPRAKPAGVLFDLDIFGPQIREIFLGFGK